MLDLKFIRENIELVQKAMDAKNTKVDLKEFQELDLKRRSVLGNLENLRSEQNKANDRISQCIKEKKDPKDEISAMKEVSAQISRMEPDLRDVEAKIKGIVLSIPHIPHESVPVGGAEKNEEIRRVGEKPQLDFQAKSHVELAESLGIIDFKTAAKITGSNFILFKNDGARLERALINFMLDFQTKENHYTEVSPPFLVNRASMIGTGQLPKMEEDMYKLAEEDLFLIPTAEVPVTNIHRDDVLKEEDLPVCYTAYSACFRREAGSYGKDTRGLMRVHQFDKVELVKFVKPQNSYDELEKLVRNAEAVLQVLGLPYRVLTLATGDLSFASAKTYDLEAYAVGIDKWLEVSSCSNFEDFQARRANIRFKGKETKKAAFCHTLNGSGLAMPRTMIAIMENYQTKEGHIVIPEILRSYMGGQERITG